MYDRKCYVDIRLLGCALVLLVMALLIIHTGLDKKGCNRSGRSCACRRRQHAGHPSVRGCGQRSVWVCSCGKPPSRFLQKKKLTFNFRK